MTKNPRVCKRRDSTSGKGDLSEGAGADYSEPIQLDTMSGQKPLRPGQCRSFVRGEFTKAMPKIVYSFVKQAEEGSVQHFNQLTKFGGFEQRPQRSTTGRRGKSFARRLLEDLKEHEAHKDQARK